MTVKCCLETCNKNCNKVDHRQLAASLSKLRVVRTAEHGHAVSMDRKCLPPLQICMELTVEPQMMVTLSHAEGAKQVYCLS